MRCTVIAPRGNIRYGDAAVTHRKPPCAYSDRNLKIYENLLAKGKKLDARGSYYYARELLAHKRYAQAVEAFETFLASGRGWTENKIDACLGLSQALTALGEHEQAKQALTRSFALEVRAVPCASDPQYADNNRLQDVLVRNRHSALGDPRQGSSGYRGR